MARRLITSLSVNGSMPSMGYTHPINTAKIKHAFGRLVITGMGSPTVEAVLFLVENMDDDPSLYTELGRIEHTGILDRAKKVNISNALLPNDKFVSVGFMVSGIGDYSVQAELWADESTFGIPSSKNDEAFDTDENVFA